MNIVVLDEVELSETQHDRLAALGSVETYRDNPADAKEAVRRLADADIAVLGWTSLGAAELGALPRLRMISVWATGYDYVDTAFAREHGVLVTNVPSYAGRAVAELTTGFLISLTRQIVTADRSVRSGAFDWHPFRGSELVGKTLGLVGVGDIGGEVAGLAKALGLRVVAHALNPSAERAAALGVEFVPLQTLLATSDIVSLHVPLTDRTRNLIGRNEIALMKPTGYLINTSRAAVVDQVALTDALAARVIAGAALDDSEFPDARLAALPTVILTPHIGFYTDQAISRKGDVCVANIAAYLAGTPANVVNG
ncbi:hypothetical protein CC117_20870 [Parafrankia colletiae]|uniref:Uncharacterized protein n=2 Tax=Parafrankia colletiae TaxID=573497 RepID=A0A1S1QIV5_9ACTN|nr:hypothetical protein [Frankia sp. Cpl3]OHV34713.1 hypothetical protein CC117_20870 [Parafrankia colletiae]